MSAQVLSPWLDRPGTRGLIAVAGLALLYLVAIDQGALLRLVQGIVAVDPMMIHEVVHDARHIAALPCH